jgi:hypothetical protein
MQIDETLLPFDVIYEASLEYENPKEAEERGGTELPVLSIGKPLWWNDQAIMGEKWIPPAGNYRYGLTRLSFSLRPLSRQVVQKVEFIVHLFSIGHEERPTAYDIYPQTITETRTGTRTIGLDPKLKFADVLEVSGFKAETTINVKESVPVIVADGANESIVRWVFQSRRERPLIGSQNVYIIVALPPGVSHARAAVEVKAEISDSVFGLVRGISSRTQSEHLSFPLS